MRPALLFYFNQQYQLKFSRLYYYFLGAADTYKTIISYIISEKAEIRSINSNHCK
jgi:hypothetical protein